MAFLIFLVILAAVVVFVTRPFLRAAGERSGRAPARSATELADLEAAREAKYREIRDAELDHRTGKLSAEDYEAIDGALRAEAIEILRELDRARGVGEASGARGVGEASTAPRIEEASRAREVGEASAALRVGGASRRSATPETSD